MVGLFSIPNGPILPPPAGCTYKKVSKTGNVEVEIIPGIFSNKAWHVVISKPLSHIATTWRIWREKAYSSISVTSHLFIAYLTSICRVFEPVSREVSRLPSSHLNSQILTQSINSICYPGYDLSNGSVGIFPDSTEIQYLRDKELTRQLKDLKLFISRFGFNRNMPEIPGAEYDYFNDVLLGDSDHGKYTTNQQKKSAIERNTLQLLPAA